MYVQPTGINRTKNRDTHILASGQGTQAAQAAVPQDGYSPCTAQMKDIVSDMARGVFKDYDVNARLLSLISQFKIEPVMFGNVAGWKSSLMDTGGTNCFIKMPTAESESMLIIPLQNHYGGSFGVPVKVNSNKGLTALADVKPFGGSQGMKVTQSPDGSRTFLTNSTSPLIKIYDQNMTPQPECDLSAISNDYGRILAIKSGSSAAYAYIISPDSKKKSILCLEPGTNKPLWEKDLKGGHARNMYEGPDGSLYVPSDESFGKNEKHYLHIFSKDGQDRGKLEFPETVEDLSFLKNGGLVVNNGYDGVRAIDVSRLKPGQYKTLWSITGKDYKEFIPAENGTSLIAMDPMKGFSRCHRLAKIDTKSGNVEWEKEFPGESFVDYRLINNELHVLTASQDHKTVHMKKLDISGNPLWQDSANLGEIDEYDEGKRNCITAEGNFVFGGRNDGCLYFLHPRKPGETEAQIQQNLVSMEDRIEEYKDAAIAEVTEENPQASSLEDDGVFIVIDGMRLRKNRLRNE